MNERNVCALNHNSVNYNNCHVSTGLCWAMATVCVYTKPVGHFGWEGGAIHRKAVVYKEDNTKEQNTHRYSFLKFLSNPRPQCLCGRRQFMPQTSSHSDRSQKRGNTFEFTSHIPLPTSHKTFITCQLQKIATDHSSTCKSPSHQP
jgi:hypothetical protein